MTRVYQNFNDILTFQRSSIGTYIGVDGIIKTASVDEPRIEYTGTADRKGLLIEEQRTNILLNSETLSTQTVSVTATTHTLSFSGTGTVTLSGASTDGPLVGTGSNHYDRVSLTFTPSSGSLTLTVSGDVEYAQLEVGPYGTSYIPTTGTAVTRSADLAEMQTSAFDFNEQVGTVIVHAYLDVSDLDDDHRIFSINNDNVTERYTAFYRSDETLGFYSRKTTGTNFDFFTANTFNAGQLNKMAFAWDQSTVSFVLNGGTVRTGSANNPPSGLTHIDFGGGPAGDPFGGTIKDFKYIPAKLTDAEIQELTSNG